MAGKGGGASAQAPGDISWPPLPAGLKIGHAGDNTGQTGTTVFLFETSALAAASIRGSAPATANFSTLDPIHSSCRIDAIMLSGGSSFGPSSVIGVQRFLEDRGQGFDVGVTSIPRVPSAAIFDLAFGDYTARPTPQMALDACLTASVAAPCEGSCGAGTGATVGKFLGIKHAMRGGFGVSHAVSAYGAQVWAFAVVNAFGDIWSRGRKEIVAGARTTPDDHVLADAGMMIKSGWRRTGYGAASRIAPPPGLPAAGGTVPRRKRQGKKAQDDGGADNTTLVVLVTTAALDLIGLSKLADICHNGIADVVSPSHTIYDGDLSMAVSMGRDEEDLTALSIIAQECVADAMLRAVRKATGTLGVPSWSDLHGPAR